MFLDHIHLPFCKPTFLVAVGFQDLLISHGGLLLPIGELRASLFLRFFVGGFHFPFSVSAGCAGASAARASLPTPIAWQIGQKFSYAPSPCSSVFSISWIREASASRVLSPASACTASF